MPGYADDISVKPDDTIYKRSKYMSQNAIMSFDRTTWHNSTYMTENTLAVGPINIWGSSSTWIKTLNSSPEVSYSTYGAEDISVG